MGCNCKNSKNISPKAPMIQVNGVTEIISPVAPPYTREDVARVERYLNSTDKSNHEEKVFFNAFNLNYFGENIGGYCDLVCQDRVRRRIDKARENLMKYEQYRKETTRKTKKDPS